jgi:methionyl-tRNA formyltransferase
MKIIFLAYRGWALDVVKQIISENSPEHTFETITSPDALSEYVHEFLSPETVFVAIGWSWIIQPNITNRFLCLGLHPSDLPSYRGGSPIQHQIIDGITKTKCSLFQLTEKLDSGVIWGKCEMSLTGDSMDEVFQNIKIATLTLLTSFLKEYPHILIESQILSQGNYVQRRKPNQSQILPADFDFSDVTKLYNKIRCLTAPYPNAYIEDDKGNRLYFEKVRFTNNGVLNDSLG